MTALNRDLTPDFNPSPTTSDTEIALPDPPAPELKNLFLGLGSWAEVLATLMLGADQMKSLMSKLHDKINHYQSLGLDVPVDVIAQILDEAITVDLMRRAFYTLASELIAANATGKSDPGKSTLGMA